MSKPSINFWVLIAASLIISALLISVFVKALKLILMTILVLALAPIVYMALRLIFPARKDNSDKLNK